MTIDRPPGPHPPILVVSDGTGSSAERLVRSMLVQFSDAEVPLIKRPGVTKVEEIDEALDLAQQRQVLMVVHTILVPGLRQHLHRRCTVAGIPSIDLVGDMLETLNDQLGAPHQFRPGLYRRLHRDYFRRVGAIDFAIAHDDGQKPQGLPDADMVLLGVSRAGKTPLSMYLAMQGWKVANIPMVPGGRLPRQLDDCDPSRLIGLTITSDLLIKHRHSRRASLGVMPNQYADPQKVFDELEEARQFFRKRRIPTVDVTNKPIEASARDVVAHLTRRLGLENLPGQDL